MRFTLLSTIATWALCAVFTPAYAHVSERALVLLLPTDIYISFGVIAVVLTVVLTVLAPSSRFETFMGSRRLTQPQEPGSEGPGNEDPEKENPENEDHDAPPGRGAEIIASTSSFVLLVILIILGFIGPRDPLENLLPLWLFTLWWVCFPVLQALAGDLWRHINPWVGPMMLVSQGRHPLTLPEGLSAWPALVTYLLASVYALTDLAPNDPDQLAMVVGGYWLFTYVMCLLFGEDWLRRGEGFTVFFTLIAKISPLSRHPLSLRFPGNAIVDAPAPHAALATFSITLLAVGSFDGLNETFWWMERLGINPLEFPGRSAVVWPNRAGLLGTVALVNLAFAFCVWLGLYLIGRSGEFWSMSCRLALTILPIAMGYHFAHYLTSALVNLQYLLAAVNDPLETGASLIGLHDFHVTTSFFNQRHTVQIIWLTQALSIVLAHMLAIILSHGIALQELRSRRMAVVSQLPVATFMVLYTFFGLWLLASPVAL